MNADDFNWKSVIWKLHTQKYWKQKMCSFIWKTETRPRNSEFVLLYKQAFFESCVEISGILMWRPVVVYYLHEVPHRSQRIPNYPSLSVKSSRNSSTFIWCFSVTTCSSILPFFPLYFHSSTDLQLRDPSRYAFLPSQSVISFNN